jgi:hypothetical protein
MSPRFLFATACTLLLLGSRTAGALAHDGFPTHAAATSAAPRVAVVGHITTYWAINHDPPKDHAVRQFTLRAAGSHFTPGAAVRTTVFNISRREALAHGSTQAQPARTTVLCHHGQRLCFLPNDHAGAIDYRVRLSPAPAVSDLQVLYRSGKDGGTQAVALR